MRSTKNKNFILLIFFFSWLHGLQDLSSSTMVWTKTPSSESRILSHWTAREFPHNICFCVCDRTQGIRKFHACGDGFEESGRFSVVRELQHEDLTKQRIRVEILGLSFTSYISTLDPPYPFRKVREKAEEALNSYLRWHCCYYTVKIYTLNIYM